MGKKRGERKTPPTSKQLDDFSAELEHAGDRRQLLNRVKSLKARLSKILTADELELVEFSGRAAKKNLAQRFSEAVAQKIANELRKEFPGILPDADGGGHESFSRGAQGLKKLDVNYSTKKSGLELAISVKTINFADDATGRYTKNAKRVDGELRAEAQDCHKRQPYAVLVAYVFLPEDAASDGQGQGISSAKHIAQVVAARSGRDGHGGPHEKVELAFVGLYRDDGQVGFHRPENIPPRDVPTDAMRFSATLKAVREVFRRRNES